MTVETILSPADIALLEGRELSEVYCVVFDVLRATSSIVTAFGHGAEAVLPVRTIEEALAFVPGSEGRRVLLAGERGGDRIEGFDLGNSPCEFTDCRGRRIVTTTTNGTVGLRACRGAGRVVVGSLLNMASVVADIRGFQPGRLLLVCAGTHERVALEDVFAAGRLLACLGMEVCGDDATVLAESVAVRFGDDAMAALLLAENGRALVKAGRLEDIRWSSRESVYGCLPVMQSDGWLMCECG